jgi:hypothetical protein
MVDSEVTRLVMVFDVEGIVGRYVADGEEVPVCGDSRPGMFFK